METLASNYLRSGDVANAATLYTSLENINPKHSRMARTCRVLNDPMAVPLPYRHQDICNALLDPLVPAEILVEDDLTAEGVQKKYQRLVLHVHPDKNPSLQAKEAFVKLANMKERALMIAERRRAEKDAREAQRQATAATTTAVKRGKRRKENNRKVGAGTTSGPPPQGLFFSDSGGKEAGLDASSNGTCVGVFNEASQEMPKFEELKKSRIKLTSLKRKDIAVGETPVWRRANTRRLGDDNLSGTCNASGKSDEKDIDEDMDGEEKLASTMPTLVLPELVLPSRGRNVAGVSATTNGRVPLSKIPWSERRGAPPPMRRKIHAANPGSSNSNSSSRADFAVKGTCGIAAMSPPASPKTEAEATSAGVSSSSTVDTGQPRGTPDDGIRVVGTEGTEGDESETVTPLPDASREEKQYPHSAREGLATSPYAEDDLQLLRDQISFLINSVGRMRNTDIQLTTDMSFEAYERQRGTAGPS